MVGVTEVLRAVTEPGDGIVINPPVYSPFFSAIAEIGREVVEAPLARGDDGWELDLDAVERGVRRGRTGAICSATRTTPPAACSRARSCERIAELADALRRRWWSRTRSTRRSMFAGATHMPFGALGDEPRSAR